jgi:Calcium binding
MTRRNSRPAVLPLRNLKKELGTNLPSLSRAKLMQLIEEAVVDAYTEEEQAAGFLTMIDEYLALPFPVKILGVDVEMWRRST